MRPKGKVASARETCKKMIVDGLYQSGGLRLFQGISRHYELASEGVRSGLRKVRKAKYVVLGYHRVGTEGVPFYCTLSQRVFAEQMRHIRRHYRVLSVSELASELQDPDAKGLGVVVTFDDGYVGTYTQAFPVLQEYNMPVTVYLAAGAIETGEILWYDQIFLRFQKVPSELSLMLERPRTYQFSSARARIDAATEVVMYLRSLPDDKRQAWCEDFARRIPLNAAEVRGCMMDWRQIRVMRQNGISFGAHTMTHPVVSRLDPERLSQEICRSKQLIEERIDQPVVDFAFPFGKSRDCGAIGAAALEPIGFRTALTTIVGVNRPGADRFRLRRMNVGGDSPIAAFAVALERLFFCQTDEEPASAVA